jgi:hypothetical protein
MGMSNWEVMHELDRDAARAEKRVAILEKALVWALSHGASANDRYDKIGFGDGGCGCCEGSLEPEEELRDVLIAAARIALGKGADDGR